MERDPIRASLVWSAIGILANLSLVPAHDNELSRMAVVEVAHDDQVGLGKNFKSLREDFKIWV